MPFPLISLVWILALLAIAGVLLWGLNSWPNLDATIKVIMRIVIIVVISIWLIYIVAGLIAGLPAIPSRR
jgi:hypothetical protein